MPRVELIFPESAVYTQRVVLNHTDMSRAGHLGFDKLVGVVHKVLNHFFDRRGLPIGDGGGVSYIVKDLAVVYQGEAHAGDIVSVHVGLGEAREKSVELYFQVNRVVGKPGGTTAGRQPVALAKLAVLCYDYDKGATVAFPPAVRKVLTHACD